MQLFGFSKSEPTSNILSTLRLPFQDNSDQTVLQNVIETLHETKEEIHDAMLMTDTRILVLLTVLFLATILFILCDVRHRCLMEEWYRDVFRQLSKREAATSNVPDASSRPVTPAAIPVIMPHEETVQVKNAGSQTQNADTDSAGLAVKETESKSKQDAESKPMQDTESKPVQDAESKPMQDTDVKPVQAKESKLMQDKESKPMRDTESKTGRDAGSKPIQDTVSTSSTTPSIETATTQSPGFRPPPHTQGRLLPAASPVIITENPGVGKPSKESGKP